MSAAEFLAEVKRVAEKWPSVKPPYMLYASEDLLLSGNYDDAVREVFDAGVEWAEYANRDRTLRLVAALEAVLALHRPVSGHPDRDDPTYRATWALCGEDADENGKCPTVLAIESALAEEGEGS